MNHLSPVWLIINADDYGMNPVVDDSILACYAAGVLSSASLMVNQPGWREAAAKARQSGLPLGLHFNLTLGKPVCAPEQVPGLVDSSGCFLPRRQLLGRLLAGQARYAEIQQELTAQCRAFLAAGLVMDHLDSHQHLHAYPRVFRVLAEYASQTGAPLRFLSAMPGLSSVPKRLSRRLKRWLLQAQAARQQRRWMKKNIRHNDILVSVFDVMQQSVPTAADYSFIFASLQALSRGSVAECEQPSCIVEWMVHPVADAQAVAGFTRIGAVSQAEYHHLLSVDFRRQLSAAGVRLARYSDIPARSDLNSNKRGVA